MPATHCTAHAGSAEQGLGRILFGSSDILRKTENGPRVFLLAFGLLLRQVRSFRSAFHPPGHCGESFLSIARRTKIVTRQPARARKARKQCAESIRWHGRGNALPLPSATDGRCPMSEEREMRTIRFPPSAKRMQRHLSTSVKRERLLLAVRRAN